MDGGGNLLLPVLWSGVLIRQDDLPVPRVALVDDTKKNPRMFKLQIATKKCFTAAQANRPAGETTVTVTFGSQCFSHVVRKKTD